MGSFYGVSDGDKKATKLSNKFKAIYNRTNYNNLINRKHPNTTGV